MAKSISLKTGTRKTSVNRSKITLAVEIVTSQKTTENAVKVSKVKVSPKSGAKATLPKATNNKPLKPAAGNKQVKGLPTASSSTKPKQGTSPTKLKSIAKSTSAPSSVAKKVPASAKRSASTSQVKKTKPKS